eukprot:4731039-Lingulodinium_polyedra.AAC.1
MGLLLGRVGQSHQHLEALDLGPLLLPVLGLAPLSVRAGPFPRFGAPDVDVRTMLQLHLPQLGQELLGPAVGLHCRLGRGRPVPLRGRPPPATRPASGPRRRSL